ncbi:MAG: VOC family protein [Segniliparus sp.]|uniref:VOC family protein n=1 Tax=Segniliparus sp. TaxID=2804064 RepID=UPI003F3EB590
MSAPEWPTLVYADAKAAVVFFARAFGFTPGMLVGSGDLVLRAELVWQGRGVAVVEAASEAAGEGAGSVSLAVDSPQEADALYERAVAAGARSVLAPHDGEGPERKGRARRFQVADPEGVLWLFAAQCPQSLADPQPLPLAQASAE